MNNYSTIQNAERSNKAHRLAIIVGIGIFLLVLISVYLFIILLPSRDDATRFSSLAQSEAGITRVRTYKASDRNGNYYSIYGDNSKGKEYLVIFNSKEKLVRRIPVSQQVSNSRLDRIYKKYRVHNVYSFAPSIYKKRPVLELSYEGQNQSLNYLTIDLKSGKVYRVIEGL
ncbi:MAG: hypothetical protein ABF703_05585 [Oenococcus sp.]|uniref:hypothetical protein n=1 Tax=Oenococcus TaxID=46254 RepID=UPI0021E90488|nr:hypothetical protein [Oenococcus kitaharae]MCV3295881.1 hypothetical protein [Oenococcus kitaharae]